MRTSWLLGLRGRAQASSAQRPATWVWNMRTPAPSGRTTTATASPSTSGQSRSTTDSCMGARRMRGPARDPGRHAMQQVLLTSEVPCSPCERSIHRNIVIGCHRTGYCFQLMYNRTCPYAFCCLGRFGRRCLTPVFKGLCSVW